MTRGRQLWIRRACFAAVLVVAALTPGPAAGWTAQLCTNPHCKAGGTVRWARLLAGSWIAGNGLTGTTPAVGQAYAALGGQVAVIAGGMTVSAYQARTGEPLWVDTLAGFPGGSAIVSVRAWPGVVTVGVSVPAAKGPADTGGPARVEVVLGATTGVRIRAHPAAPFGGAAAAGAAATVIVGVRAVTSYSNRTGRVLWSRPTGSVPQAWQVDRDHLYVAVAAQGYLGTAPVTALRQINLRTGAERVLHPRGRVFAGALSMAFDNVVLFSDAGGVTAYSGITGEQLWRSPGALPDAVDAATGRLYLISGNALLEVDPLTGERLARVSGVAAAASSGLYAVSGGTVLGLDQGAFGKAWGYDTGAQRVTWTSRPLPWPHYFVDLSGIGGSAPPGEDAVLLAICAQLGAPLPGNAGQRCARPELVALNR